MKNPEIVIKEARLLCNELTMSNEYLGPQEMLAKFHDLLQAAEEIERLCTLLRDIAAGQGARVARVLTPPTVRADGDRFRETRAEAIDATGSLAEAVCAAGGRFNASMLAMTVSDFIATIAAQNGIRFHYSGPAPTDA